MRIRIKSKAYLTGFCFLGMLLLMSACNDRKSKINKQVKELEKSITKGFNKEKASELLTMYNQYIKTYPEDTTCKRMMVNAVEISILNNDGKSALAYIDDFMTRYPDDPRTPGLQFKKGMIYDLLLNDQIKSGAEYQKFITLYPNHPFRQEAENAILLIQDPEAFTRMLTGDSAQVTTSADQGAK